MIRIRKAAAARITVSRTPPTMRWPAFMIRSSHKILMDVQTAKSSSGPTCGQRMILIKDVPRIGALPALSIYKCQESGVPRILRTHSAATPGAPRVQRLSCRLVEAFVAQSAKEHLFAAGATPECYLCWQSDKTLSIRSTLPYRSLPPYRACSKYRSHLFRPSSRADGSARIFCGAVSTWYPSNRESGTLQCLVGNYVGECVFISFVEFGSGGAQIVHMMCPVNSLPSVSSRAMVDTRDCSRIF